jgi:hypothetical protein
LPKGLRRRVVIEALLIRFERIVAALERIVTQLYL